MNPVPTSQDGSICKRVSRVGLTNDRKTDVYILSNSQTDHTVLRNTPEGIRMTNVKAKFHDALTFAVDYFDGE